MPKINTSKTQRNITTTDAKQLWIIIHNNVIYAICSVITKENLNQSYSAPIVRGKLYGISVDWSQTVSPPLQGGRLRSVCYHRLNNIQLQILIYSVYTQQHTGYCASGGGGHQSILHPHSLPTYNLKLTNNSWVN